MGRARARENSTPVPGGPTGGKSPDMNIDFGAFFLTTGRAIFWGEMPRETVDARDRAGGDKRGLGFPSAFRARAKSAKCHFLSDFRAVFFGAKDCFALFLEGSLGDFARTARSVHDMQAETFPESISRPSEQFSAARAFFSGTAPPFFISRAGKKKFARVPGSGPPLGDV